MACNRNTACVAVSFSDLVQPNLCELYSYSGDAVRAVDGTRIPDVLGDPFELNSGE